MRRFKRTSIFMLTLCLFASLGLAMFTAASAETEYEAEKVFTAATAPLEYREDGSIVVGDGDGTNTAQLWTNPGQYTFAQPFSVTFRLNGLPSNELGAARKDSYFFLKQPGTEKEVWFNLLVASYGDGHYEPRLNITIKDTYFIQDNFVLSDLDLSQSVTLTYNYAKKKASVEYAGGSHEFDLTKTPDGSPFAYVGELPDGDIQLSLMNTHGGVIVERINGSAFKYEAPDSGFETRPNFDDDFFYDLSNSADVTYENRGAVITNGDRADGTLKMATVNSKYALDGVADTVFRFEDLQPAAATTAKNLFFIYEAGGARVTLKMFAYCTSDNEADAQYILHVEAFTGEEGTGRYFARTTNLLWDVKDYGNVLLRVKYDAAKKKIKIFNVTANAKSEIDLTKDADGAPYEDALPEGNLAMHILVGNGGVAVESVNEHLLRFNRADYELGYTDRRDFFTDESTARVAYRNEGIFISNNDMTSVNYLSAKGKADEWYESGNMIFEYKYDCLQTYDPNVPLSIMKAVWFRISDEEGNKIGLQPFLYKSGNSQLMHINIQYNGRMIYENHLIGYDFADYNSYVLYLKYDGTAKTVTLGSTIAQETIDLSVSYNGTINQGPVDTSAMPSGKLRLDSVDVQFGGIYLRRVNNYSFVVEDPSVPDPVDPVITDFDLPDVTFDKEISVTPAVSFGDYEDAEFTLSVKKPGEEEYEALSGEGGTYVYEFGEYGVYTFRYKLAFDGIETTADRTVEYRSSTVNSLEELYSVNNGTYTVTEEGLKFTSVSAENSTTGAGISAFEVAGKTTVRAKLVELQPASEGVTPTYKEMWFDFTNGKDGVWVNVFAFSAAGTSGRYPAYASVFTFKNGDKGTQIKVQENVALGFNFDLEGGGVDPSAEAEIIYEPSARRVSVGKVGEIATSFDLVGHDIPVGKFSVNVGFNYGSMIVTSIDGISFAGGDGEREYPAPFIALDMIPSSLLVGGTLTVPKNATYDLFDLRPVLTASLKDGDGNAVAMNESEESYSAVLDKEGSYTLTVKAENARGLTSEQTITVYAIPEDKEPPSITFAQDAFDGYEKGDRDNKYKVKKGTVIDLPMPILSDDSNLPVELKVSVTDPKGNISLVSGMKLEVNTIGTYYVEFAATDVTGKTNSVIIQFIVMLDRGEEDPAPGPSGGCNGCGGAAGGELILGGLLPIFAAIAKRRRKF